MPPITNNQLNDAIKQLREQFDRNESQMSDRVGQMDKRMKTLEERAVPVLERIDTFFLVWQKFLKFLRGTLIFLISAAILDIIAWVIPRLLGH